LAVDSTQLAGLLIAVIGTGAIFTLLTITDLLEEQVRLLR
jgi:hypothetical protein